MDEARSNSPCTIKELRNILLWPTSGIMVFPEEDYDEVYPGLYLGDCWAALDLDLMKTLDVGFVLNAAHGNDSSLNQVDTGEVYYAPHGIRYLGVPALDLTSFPIEKYFDEVTNFIQEGLKSGKKVFVHCKQGISRSACLVLAFLVIVERYTIQEASRMVREKREILPNDGFIQKLCELDHSLKAHGNVSNN